MTTRNDQRGVAHVLLVGLVIVVVAVIGFAGYKVIGGKNNSTADTAVDKAIYQAAKAECDKLNDDDLCKFYTNWQSHKQYKMVSTGPTGLTIEVDGDSSHVTIGGDIGFESITVGKDYYVKGGDTWYKQTSKEDVINASTKVPINFDAPADDETTASEDKTVYKKLGKDACGNLQCYKYEIIEPGAANSKQFLWFDDKDYQVRKYSSETADGVAEMTFEYGNVSIKAPSPVKTLKADQYIVPGETEPRTSFETIEPTGGN